MNTNDGSRVTAKPLALAVGVITLSVITGVAFWVWQGKPTSQAARNEKPLEGLQVFGTVPDFTLTERSGRQAQLSELRGKVWIANFIYTSCPDTCPLQTAELRDVQKEFEKEKDLRAVSITVDPKRDTPGVLAKYAERFHADRERWLFLTGDEDAIYSLAQQGFRLGVAEIPEAKRERADATHAHSPRFVLVDRQARIRGYYPATEPEALRRMRSDLSKLLREIG
jgi:protein SCO1/2